MWSIVLHCLHACIFFACTNTHTSLFCWCIKSTSLDKVACSFLYLFYLFPINRSFDRVAVSFWYLFHSFLLRLNFLQTISLYDFVLSFILILDNFFFSQLSQVWCLCVFYMSLTLCEHIILHQIQESFLEMIFWFVFNPYLSQCMTSVKSPDWILLPDLLFVVLIEKTIVVLIHGSMCRSGVLCVSQCFFLLY